MRRVGVACLVGLLAAGCAAPAADVAKVKNDLMARDREWAQTTKELDKFLSYYTADASVYLPEMPIVTGTAAIRETFTKFTQIPGFSITWVAGKADVGTGGDLGYTAGAYTMTMNDSAGKPIVDKGKYLTVWKKQADGSWKASDDILNSDAPPPVPAPPPPPPNIKK